MPTNENTESNIQQDEHLSLWSGLEAERVSRIAGDDANNTRTNLIQDNLFDTENRLSTEVIHREQGDLNSLGTLNSLTLAMSDYRIKTDLEINAEKIARQQLGVDLNAYVSSINSSFNHREHQLYEAINTFKSSYYEDQDELNRRITKYEDMLQDITTDSIQITMDNGDINMGAWTILSQAREWDLEILGKVKGFQNTTTDEINQALIEIQQKLPVEENLISKLIDGLSSTPIIQELSDRLNESISAQEDLGLQLAQEAVTRSEEIIRLAAQQAETLALEKQDLVNRIAQEAEERVDAITREADIRSMQLTQIEDDKAVIEADMEAIRLSVSNAEDGLTTEIQQRKDGDISNLNALNTYKVSNDSAISGLSTSISNNVTKTSANTTAIAGLTSRLTTAETETGNVRTLAADAFNKASSAITANSALSTRVDALAASLTESDGTVVDVNAFNALKAEVNTNKGSITSLVEDVTALENNYTTINNNQITQGTAISNLTTKMTAAESTIQQSADDIVLLKSDITSINGTLTNKVDAQAFNNLSTSVATLEDGLSTQASSITSLQGSLETTNVNVSNAANAAQNAMNVAGAKGKVIFGTTAPVAADRLSQNLWIDTTGNANTPKRWNGSAWVEVTDKVATDALAAANAATTLANTKADASAFNSLDQKVTVIDGQVSTNTNSITSLNGKISTVEGNLATKLDSSAIVNYYTKQQTDDKATSIAAGEISKYNASLVIGGANLLTETKTFNKAGTLELSKTTLRPNYMGFGSAFVTDHASMLWRTHTVVQVRKDWCGFYYSCNSDNPDDWFADQDMMLSVWVKNSTNTDIKAYGIVPALGLVATIPIGEWQRIEVRIEKGRALRNYNNQGIIEFHNPSTEGAFYYAAPMLQYGNAVTSWQPSQEEVQNALDANASAIQSTNSEVTRVDGKTTTNANAITGLTSRMGTVEGQVSTKADASALNSYYTKTETDDKATTIAAGEVSKYDANLVIGGSNLIKNSNFEGELGSSNWSANYWGSWIKQQDAVHGTVLKCVYGSITHDWINVEEGATLVYSAMVRSPVDRSMYNTVPLHCWAGKDNTQQDKYEVLKKSHDVIPAGVWTKIWVVIKLTGDANSFKPFIYDTTPLDGFEIAWTKLEKGTKVTDWTPNNSEVQQSINANASAIQVTNAEVFRINGEVVSTAYNVNNLTSSVGLLQGSIDEVRQTVTNNQESTNTLMTSLRSGMADADDVSMMMRSAAVVFEDLSFKNGWNGVAVYNNYGNGALVTYFTDKLPDNPVASTRQLQFIHSGGATTPGLGGFHQTVQSRANGVFLVKFVAKLPVGFSFDLTANAYGDGSNGYFIGSSEGTGKFKTYHAVYRCGATGSFSTIGFVFVNGSQPTAENPLIWYLASSTVYDCLDSKVAPDSVINGIAEAKTIASTAVTKSEATALLAQNLQTALDNTNANISNNYYTKSQADTATAGHISSYDANLVIGGVNTYDNETTPISGLVGNPQVPYRNSGDTPNGFHLIGDSTGQSAIRLGGVITEAGWWTISFYIKGSQSFSVGFKIDIVDGDEYLVRTTADNTWKYVQYSSYVAHVDSNYHFIDFSDIGWAYIFLKDIKVERGRKATAWTPSNRHVLDSLSLNATAIQSTKAEVLRIDGVVTSQASQIVTLESSKSAIENGAIAGNNEIVIDLTDPAYNRDLYYPVLLSNFSTIARQTIRIFTSLDMSSVPPWASHGAGFSLNAQFQMGGAAWGVIDPEIVTDNFTHAWTHGGISPLDQIGQIWESSQPFFYVRGGGYYKLSKPVSRSVQVCAPNGSLSGYHGAVLYPRPYQESTVPKSINQGLNQQNVKLQQTNTVLNGVKAVSTVTVDNNGVMSGYGLISELANGQVTSAFGVNADTFFIGAPYLNKKPFIHRNDWSQINGVWVPPGTYIDTALIANATIGTAKIADLAVTGAKIANATITDANISNLSAGKITTGTMHGDRITAGTINVNRLDTTTLNTVGLSALSANLGTMVSYANPANIYGARTIIKGDVIEVYDDSNRLRVRLGRW